jgi:hypothetical protein
MSREGVSGAYEQVAPNVFYVKHKIKTLSYLALKL